jgi:hypothetical protein
MTIESDLLSQINKLLANLANLNSSVELYTQVRSLEKDLNTLEKKYESLIKTSTCNAQCKKINKTSESNSVDDFLVQLLLSKSKYNHPPMVPQDVGFTRPLFVVNPQASAPPALEKEASAPPAESEE